MLRGEFQMLPQLGNIEFQYIKEEHNRTRVEVPPINLQYIDGPLKDEHDLDLSVRSKPVMGVDDLLVILHYHWALDKTTFPHERQRIQLSLLLLMIAYTSSRPGALIESGCLRGSNEALCYKDVHVLIIKNPEEPGHNMIVMEVTLRFMKGKRGKSQPTTYLFHKRDGNLALCPILQFLALAFADDAFEAEGVYSLEDIFRLNIEAPRNSLQLKWKHLRLDSPIFRRTVRISDGIRISPDKALQRGTANAVDGVATTAERNQVLGHSRSDIFLRYYISERVKRDVQSAYLGRPARDALIRAVGRMSLARDPHAPNALSPKMLSEIKHHPRIMELQKKRRVVSAKIRLNYRKIKNAKGTDAYRRYTQLCGNIASERQFLRSSKLEDIRREFFNTINTIEIERQLSGCQASEIKDLEVAHFTFDERSRLVNVLFAFSDNVMTDKSRLLD
ncbi:hypothetical protein FGG08_000573 [Glutinoglossum americanum]|uniref:FluG domain-containing protein n=1 Tax=Glutinoglossum americanum TaxID=1670608 RepID=A0A9P8I8P0_9PEZI|nr:hypothetical protein FGG08_000573 [Glutinoglossum americanum]